MTTGRGYGRVRQTHVEMRLSECDPILMCWRVSSPVDKTMGGLGNSTDTHGACIP